MGLFDRMLKDDESLFLNPEQLDFDFQPKIIKFREAHQETIADAIRPLFQKRNGKNVLVHGPPGVGKTVSIKHVLDELEQHESDIHLIYLNCWKRETSHKIALGICEQIHYPWIQNKNTDELLQKIAEILNKSSAVIVLDEFDKLEDHKILYSLLEEIYKKTLILITNRKDIVMDIDERVLSRLTLSDLAFEPYTPGQVHAILEQRKNYAFVPNSFSDEAFQNVVHATLKTGDIRTGLFLLKESANAAERRSSRKVEEKDVENTLKNTAFVIKKETQLNDGENEVLTLIKTYGGKSAKQLYDIYRGEKSFRTFQRILNSLEEGRMITIKDDKNTEQGGSIRTYYFGVDKKLQEFQSDLNNTQQK